MNSLRSFYSSALWRYGFIVFCLALLLARWMAWTGERAANSTFPLGGVVVPILLLALHINSSWLSEGRFKNWFTGLIGACVVGYIGYEMTHPFSPGRALFFAIVMGLVCWWVFSRPNRSQGKEVQDA